MKAPNLHVLNFTSPDVEQAISKLQDIHNENHINGLMFIVKVADRKRPMVGAAGCCINDPMLAIGAAGYLYAAVIDNQFNG